MTTALGLVGLVIFICGIIALAAGVTWAVVKMFPPKDKRKPKPPPPAAEPAAE